jgi:ABC-type dipeptide/oligopeptide/nickel transport system permease subunit
MAEKKFNRTVFKRLLRHKLAVIGLSIIFVMVVLALLADLIAPNPYSMNLDAKLTPPLKSVHAIQSIEQFQAKEYIYEVSDSTESYNEKVGINGESVEFVMIGKALEIELPDGTRETVPVNNNTLPPGYKIIGEHPSLNTFRSTKSITVLRHIVDFRAEGDHTKTTREVIAGDFIDVEWADMGVAYVVIDNESGNKRLHIKGSHDLKPTEMELGPIPKPILGTDNSGRDIAQRIIHGSRVSLAVGIVVITASLLVGIILGAIAGFYGGWIDNFISRITDIMFAFPSLLFAIAVMSVFGRDIYNVFIALGLVGWPPIVRIIRGEVVSMKESEFVEAARSMGAKNRRIIFKHLLPNMLAPIIVYVSLGIAGAIMSEAGLSFLGIGVRPPMPSWGSMINEGFPHALNAPHVWLVPGIVIALVVLAFNFLGDGLRDALDPKLKI